MRILLVTPFLPHAGIAHGGGVYVRGLLEQWVTKADVALVALARPADASLGRSALPAGLASASVVVWPQKADATSAGAKLQHVARNAWRCLVGGQPLVAAKHASATFAQVLRSAAESFRPDACLVEFATMAQYLPALSGFFRVLTDHEAGGPVPAHAATGGRAESSGADTRAMSRDARRWERYVARYYPMAERLQVLNDPDAVALARRLGRGSGEPEIAVRQASVALPAAADVVRPAAAPKTALFLGDYSHHPNPEAVRRLLQEVWPAVRERVPGAKLRIAGPRMSAALQQELQRSGEVGVSVDGFVPDLVGLLRQVRCLIAPMWSGAGSRIKVRTALSHGLPVVSNALGARGVSGLEAPALRLGETATELANALVAALEDGGPGAGDAARRWAENDPESLPAVAEAQLARLAAWM